MLASLEPDSNVIVVSPEPLNAKSPMLVTFSGMVMALRAGVLANALFPILVTLAGIVKDVKLAKHENMLALRLVN
jgi:hypothetical protein